MPEFYLKNIQAVIFDAEGVVVDTETVWDAVQREFLGRRGLEYDRDTLKPLMAGRPGEQAVGVLKERFGLPGHVRDLLAERDTIFADLLGREIRFIEGFPQFFRQTEQAGLRTAMATSMSRAMLARADAALGIVKMFGSRIVTGDDVRRGKPSPDIYLQAAALADAAPENCLAVEDTPIGLQAARAANMQTMGLCTTFGPERLSGLAHVVADGYAGATGELFRGTD